MTTAAGPRVAIIGSGFSGSLLAVQLLRRFLPGGRVYLIEKNAKFGGGLAYSTGNPNHLLNVRAGRMSAFADQPDHFTNWLRDCAKVKAPPKPTGAAPTSSCRAASTAPTSRTCSATRSGRPAMAAISTWCRTRP